MTFDTLCPTCGEHARRTVLRLENGRVYDATVCHECERVYENGSRPWWKRALLWMAFAALMVVIVNDIVVGYIR